MFNFDTYTTLIQHYMPPGVKGFQKGNSIGNRFTSETQPEEKGRKAGVQNRNTIARKILALTRVYPTKELEELKKLYPEIDNSMTTEEMIYIIQADKAITDKDTPAAKFIIDSAYGAPKQEIDMTSDGERINPIVTVVYTDVKLASSEKEVDL